MSSASSRSRRSSARDPSLLAGKGTPGDSKEANGIGGQLAGVEALGVLSASSFPALSLTPWNVQAPADAQPQAEGPASADPGALHTCVDKTWSSCFCWSVLFVLTLQTIQGKVTTQAMPIRGPRLRLRPRPRLQCSSGGALWGWTRQVIAL
jgi:hypothetical protein